MLMVKVLMMSNHVFRTTICLEDWVEVWGVGRTGWSPLGRYCGLTAPGPLVSPRGALGLAVLLHADSEGVASGFKARYTFEVSKSLSLPLKLDI